LLKPQSFHPSTVAVEFKSSRDSWGCSKVSIMIAGVSIVEHSYSKRV